MGHHKKKKKHKSKHRKHFSDSDSPEERSKKRKLIGPLLPTVLPRLTPTQPVKPISVVASTSSQSDSYGPQLPPNLCGPQLPPHLSKPKIDDTRPQPHPVEEKEDYDDGNIIGPLPANMHSPTSAQQALDERAEILKYEFLIKGTGTEDITQRESWMTELPPEKANYCGLGPRKFRQSTNFGDPKNRALWTETPLDKNKPRQEPVEEANRFEDLVVEQRNTIMDQIVQKNEEKKEKKSLLEIHREKLKKKQKNKDEKQARRPFDRDIDLEVNKFDDAQKKSMLKKAQFLDSRFAHGKSKYL